MHNRKKTGTSDDQIVADIIGNFMRSKPTSHGLREVMLIPMTFPFRICGAGDNQRTAFWFQ